MNTVALFGKGLNDSAGRLFQYKIVLLRDEKLFALFFCDRHLILNWWPFLPQYLGFSTFFLKFTHAFSPFSVRKSAQSLFMWCRFYSCKKWGCAVIFKTIIIIWFYMTPLLKGYDSAKVIRNFDQYFSVVYFHILIIFMTLTIRIVTWIRCYTHWYFQSWTPDRFIPLFHPFIMYAVIWYAI
jgi:hypothetical protein